jgi:hypothetical protein
VGSLVKGADLFMTRGNGVGGLLFIDGVVSIEGQELIGVA